MGAMLSNCIGLREKGRAADIEIKVLEDEQLG
jgi:hypothetical protein